MLAGAGMHRGKQLSNTSTVMYAMAVPSTEMSMAIPDTPPLTNHHLAIDVCLSQIWWLLW